MFLGLSTDSLQSNFVDKELHAQLQQQRYKTVDCKLLHVLLQDLRNRKMMSKVKETEYIFVMNSAYSAKQKNRIKAKQLREITKSQQYNIRGLDESKAQSLSLN